MTGSDVSVVVCTFNRAHFLHGAIDSLLALETGGRLRYEILVVDNASTDDTSQVVAEVARRAAVPVRYAYEERPGIACARNRGVKEALGEWIAFFDDDEIADRRWLEELRATAIAKNARCVGGAVRLLFPDTLPRHLWPVYQRLLGQFGRPDVSCRYGRTMVPGTGNLLVHRSIFDQVGGFDESLQRGGEDTELFSRLMAANIDAWYAPRAIVHHLVPPYRLTPEYLRWNYLCDGNQAAEVDRATRGASARTFRCCARLGQALAMGLLRRLRARLGSNEVELLPMRCRLWRAEGYIRSALHSMAPRLFAQRAFLARLEFRGERAIFSGPEGGLLP
jgi:glycosyltransferase involved in cell wall biosynthesis